MWALVQEIGSNCHVLVDDDGMRLLACDELLVPAHVWPQAVAQGVSLVAALALEGGFWVCSAEEFLEKRVEDHARQSYTVPTLHHFSQVPSYRAFFEGLLAERARRPHDNFANLHCHSEFSSLDGLSTMEEMAERLVEMGQDHMAVTDHGVCAGHYHLQKAAVAKGLHPIFGIEAYFVHDRKVHEDQYGYMHLVVIAKSQKGLSNLWALSTAANQEESYYGHPRMDWELLEQFAEGLICTTACIRGPLAVPLIAENDEEVIETLGKLLGIFRSDLYVELGTSTTPLQERVNLSLAELAQKAGVPLLAGVDSHYSRPEEYDVHQAWVRAGTFTSGTDTEAKLFSDKMPYHLASRSEVIERFAYLPSSAVTEALDNTVSLAASCTAEFPVKQAMPMFAPSKGRSYAVERAFDLIEGNWERKVRSSSIPEEDYLARVESEMNLLIPKDFVDNFMITADYVRWAKSNGILVGPARGSSAGSLVADLLDITEINPLEYGIPFSRFMTKGRTEPPDFDVDFPTSARDRMQHYVSERWGFEHVARVGTHGRLKNKAVVRQVARVLQGTEQEVNHRDIDLICKVIEAEEASSAGLGYSWDAVMGANEEVLASYIEKYPLLFELCEKLVGRLKSYGRHAAGLVISTAEPLAGRLPMRRGDSDQLVSEFDYATSEAMGLLKFDFLTLRTLDTIDACVRDIQAKYGTKIDFYSWKEEYHDPLVWEEISSGNTLGVFQAETRLMTKLIRRLRPSSIQEMSDAIALVRPGPSRSGITDAYIERKEGLQEVLYDDPRLKDVLAPTYGLVVYQEQLMAICTVLAGYDDVEADHVRKILGKKKRELVEEEGRKFVAAAVPRGIEEDRAVALWAKLSEFAKYVFNLGHSISYSFLAYWTAWLKVHYPNEYLTALLSTVDKDDVPRFAAEARRQGFKVLAPDINLSDKGFTSSGTDIRYGLANIKGVGDKAVDVILENRPYVSFEDFKAKMAAIPRNPCHKGPISVLAAVGAFDSLVPNRRSLEAQLSQTYSGESAVCTYKNDTLNEHGLPCTFDWTSELVEYTKRGLAKVKPVPKRCTKGCRQYVPVGLSLPDAPYTPQEIMEKELEYLGVWLTHTPFDIIPSEERDQLYVAEEIETGPNGFYNTAAVINSVRQTKVKATGERMGIVSMTAFTSEIDVAFFPAAWAEYSGVLRPHKLVLLEVRKNDKGLSCSVAMPV